MSERQSRSDIVGTARPPQPDEMLLVDWSELTRYDLLLAAIPLVILAAAVVGYVAALPLWASLTIGGLVALPMVVDGVALNPPT